MQAQIINKATSLFLNFGFKSVTMDDIAQEMAISKKTIYTYFKTKTALVEAVTHSLFEVVTEGIDTICALEKNPIAELYEIKKWVMSQLKNEKASPQYQLQKYYPQLHEAFYKMHFKKVYECSNANVKRGIAQGLYRKNLNPEFISRIYFLCVNGLKDPNLFSPESFNKTQLMEDYLEYHLRGIVTKEGLNVLKTHLKTHPYND